MRAGKNQTINCQTSKMSREKDKRHGLFKITKKKKSIKMSGTSVYLSITTLDVKFLQLKDKDWQIGSINETQQMSGFLQAHTEIDADGGAVEEMAFQANEI